MTSRADIANMIDYFWTVKGDIERWSSLDMAELEREFPAVAMAWRNYKFAEKVMNLVVEDMKDHEATTHD